MATFTIVIQCVDADEYAIVSARLLAEAPPNTQVTYEPTLNKATLVTEVQFT